MWDPELTSPTAGTEGGSTSCFHFWSKTFWSVTKDQHPHASLFRTPGSRVGTDASPHPPPRRRTNPDHRNSRGTSLVGHVSPWQGCTSSLPSPPPPGAMPPIPTPSPLGTAFPIGSRERKAASELEARTCSPSYPAVNVCAWTQGMRRLRRSGPKPGSKLSGSGPQSGSEIFFPLGICIPALFPASTTPLHPAPSSADLQPPRMHSHPPLWVL